jgi:hypothetical protein
MIWQPEVGVVADHGVQADIEGEGSTSGVYGKKKDKETASQKEAGLGAVCGTKPLP